jgi:hypothetical protein
MLSAEQKRSRRDSRGPNLAPVQEILEAQKLYLEGKNEESLSKLSQSIGSDSPLPRLSGRLDKVFTPGTPLSDLTVHLALNESRRRK